MLALCGRQFATVAARNVSVELQHGLLLDHHPGDPCIGHGEQKEQADNCTGTETQKLDAKGKRKEHAGREDVDGPFETHATVLCS